MQIILLSKGQRKTLNISSVGRKATIAMMMGLMSVLAGSFYVFNTSGLMASSGPSEVVAEMLKQRSDLERMREKTQNTLDGIALRVGQMQAQLTRLNAVGEHLAKKAKLSSAEFDFDQPPAIGSADLLASMDSLSENQLLQNIQVLDEQLFKREKQLELLGHFSANKKLSKEVRPAGLPVEKGWLSSHYGYRIDPFSGRKAFHHGVDIAGKTGTNVLAAASGIITFAGKKSGYGNLIEIDHGSGYVTRYGHNKEVLVKTGDVIKQNDIISKMGSTGRSTGPHVHFEVLRDGKKVNPRKYLYSAR